MYNTQEGEVGVIINNTITSLVKTPSLGKSGAGICAHSCSCRVGEICSRATIFHSHTEHSGHLILALIIKGGREEGGQIHLKSGTQKGGKDLDTS